MDQIPWMLVFWTAIALIVVILMVEVLKRFSRGTDRGGDYVSRKALKPGTLTAFTRVSEALPDHIVLAEVGIEAILEPGDWLSSGRKQQALARLSQKRADIVVCDQAGVCVAVIEIDDRSRNQDNDLQKILESAGLKTLRWPATNLPFGDEIRAAVLGANLAFAEVAQPDRQIPTLWQRT